jgi:hypothetical protein
MYKSVVLLLLDSVLVSEFNEIVLGLGPAAEFWIIEGT